LESWRDHGRQGGAAQCESLGQKNIVLRPAQSARAYSKKRMNKLHAVFAPADADYCSFTAGRITRMADTGSRPLVRSRSSGKSTTPSLRNYRRARALFGGRGKDELMPASAGCSFMLIANCMGCCCRLSTTSFHSSRSCFTRSS